MKLTRTIVTDPPCPTCGWMGPHECKNIVRAPCDYVDRIASRSDERNGWLPLDDVAAAANSYSKYRYANERHGLYSIDDILRALHACGYAVTKRPNAVKEQG